MEEKIWHLLREINEEIPNEATAELLNGGYIDSFAIVNIVAALEEEFEVELEAEDIIPENFNTISAIANVVRLRQGN